MEHATDCLRNKMQNGEILCGCHTSWGGAMVPEMYGVAGFDLVWIDTEHGNMDPKEVQNALIGAKAGGLAAVVRIPWNRAYMAKPLLDIGADGIVFPMVCSAEEAKEAVAACRYPPEGSRGYGPFRATRYGTVEKTEYIKNASRKVWVMPQVEHINAVRNLDSILAVPGIDAIVIGMCDLSGSMGMLGEINHPEVKKVMDEIAEKANAAGVPVGVSMIWDEEAARDWVRRGAKILFCDNEATYVMKGCRKTLSRLKEVAVSR